MGREGQNTLTGYNKDPQKSAQPCGCDEGAKHMCEACANMGGGYGSSQRRPKTLNGWQQRDAIVDFPTPAPTIAQTKRIGLIVEDRQLFPDSAQGRKDHPVFTGVLMYFPDAIAAVARVSKMGNDQHNPGQPLHWAREKSTDQTDTATRHMMDHGVGTIKDTDGMYHLAKAAWRILAELQLTIEQERKGQ